LFKSTTSRSDAAATTMEEAKTNDVAGAGRDQSTEAALMDQGRSVAFYRRGVLISSCGMLGIFWGFQAAQGLQTTLNATLGYINLACIYGTFTLFCILAPPIIEFLGSRTGLRPVMFVCGLAYATNVVSNIYVEVWAFPIGTSVLVGIAAPLLFTCQNDYVGRCAYHAAGRLSTSEGINEEQSLATMTSRFTSLFFSIFQFAGMLGSVSASVLMLAFAGKSWMKDVLFCMLGGMSILGSLGLLFVPAVASTSMQRESASVKDTLALAFGDARMTLFIPLIFTNGMALAFIFGDFPVDVVCPTAGPSMTGFCVAIFFGVNSVTTAIWGRLVSKRVVQRRSAFIISGICQLVFFLLQFLKLPRNFEQHDGSWREVRSPSWSSVLHIFLMVAVFALGDAFWECGPPAALQNFLLGSPAVVPAMANTKMWQSLGYATQFVIGVLLREYATVRVVLLLVLLIVSIVSVMVLDRRASLQ